MNPPWIATIPLDMPLAQQLIARQFPALGAANISLLGIGWDNVAYLLTEQRGQTVFRFPRRQIAAELLSREARILPLLAPQLPLPIPLPRYLGTPTADYPFPFVGYPFLQGRTACEWVSTSDDRAALAPHLGAFLRALHRLPLDAATRSWAPGDDIARSDLPGRAPQLIARLRANAAAFPEAAVRTLVTLVEKLATTPARAGEPCWVHGDLYARHLLLDGPAQLTSIIDWGDVHLGDPALDLSIAASFLPPRAHVAFRAAYGPIDEATWRRARFRAIHYGALLSEYGAATANPTIARLGNEALQLALAHR